MSVQSTLGPPLHPAVRFMRVTVAVQAAVILAQAFTAGLLLSSVPEGRTLHSALTGAVLLAVVANLVAAALVWRRGGGSPRVVAQSVPMVVFTVLQAALGATHVRELHVPLGVLMFGASVMLAMRVWSAGDGTAR
ncbi:hypothetical protein [Actinomadura macrotermitis]|uniref:Integral membrane protein n=1 Tax=Actinomadura macrotermitis TaxID=2585200 RepID=A0A7K0BWB8_9ACTN|nr:hypothetical protein [Actinomadura macrotermitis]MQY05461.1 hypothetical protein [Actinomadura macrotermitis]